MKHRLCALAVLCLAVAAYGKTLIVNNNASNKGSPCASAAYTTISAAIAAAHVGDTIDVCPGAYPEALLINKSNLTIVGIATNGSSLIELLPTAGINATDIDSSASQPIENVVVLVDSVQGVTLNNISVNGSLATKVLGCAPGNAGIYFRNASGTVTNSAVAYIGLNPDGTVTGCQEGLGIYVDSGAGGHANLTVSNTSVHDYDKNGITATQSGTQLTAFANTVTGAGPTTATAQNGIEVADGAKGYVNGNIVTANDYTPSSSAATSILFYDAAPYGQANNNFISESNNGIYFYDTNNGTANGNNISKMYNYSALEVTGNYAVFEHNVVTRSGLEEDQPGIYLCGSKNVVEWNQVQDAPIGVQDDRTTADQCNGATGNIVSFDNFYNVGMDIETLTDSGPIVRTNAAMRLGSGHAMVKPSPYE